MKFRPDIEGLRALAILPVVVFHAWPALLPGGFVGVDVFFVISGYLITTLLLQRLAEGQYSIARFYAARVRRIFPAFFAMLAVTLPLAWLVLTPSALAEFARVFGATGVFLSNQELYRTADYFGTAAALQPLVHTWSLAVEEQYYIVFPLLLAALWRWAPRAIPWALGGLGLLSLLYSQWLLRDNAPLAYYSTMSRTFELMVGSGLAWLMVQRPFGPARGRSVLSALGLAAVVAACVVLRNDSPFPGMAALMPCVGAALLIWTGGGPGTAVSRALSWGPLRWVGGLSFSLYLWHWPALIFTRHALLDEPNAWQAGAAVAVAVLLAWASLRWIESPVRTAQQLGQRIVLMGGALSIAVCVATALSVHRWAQTHANTPFLMSAHDSNPDRQRCHATLGRPVPYDKRCLRGPQSADTEFTVWADSHGAELAFVLHEQLPGQRVAQLTSSSCPPALGYAVPSRPDCQRHNDAMLAGLVANPKATRVILTARYESYLSQRHPARFEQGIRKSIERLQQAGKQVWLLAPIPSYGYPVPAALWQRQRRGQDPATQGLRVAQFEHRQADALRLVQRLATQTGVRLLSVSDALCRQGVCRVLDDAQHPLYFDDNHLSLAGARLVAAYWAPNWR